MRRSEKGAAFLIALGGLVLISALAAAALTLTTAPAARATDKIRPVIIAGVAIGKTVRHSVSALVAPRAKLPSRMERGMRVKPSSVETMTTGTVRMASVSDDQSKPGVPNVGAGRASGKNNLSILPPKK